MPRPRASIEVLIRDAVRDEIRSNLTPYLERLIQPEPRVHSVADVSTILQISDDTVRRMVESGALPRVAVPGRTLIPRWAIDALVEIQNSGRIGSEASESSA